MIITLFGNTISGAALASASHNPLLNLDCVEALSEAGPQMANRDGWPMSMDAQLQLLDQVANPKDAEMHPAAADIIYLVVDTNVLLDHVRILKSLVEDIASANVPITVICPGVVLHELDQQKKDSNLGRRARAATDWMLREVTRKDLPRLVVRGQARQETCKSTKNWKLNDQEGAWSDNDDLIIDCCKYFQTQAATVLYSCDKNLCLRCNQEGLRFIAPPPPHEYTSRELIQYLLQMLPEYGIYLNRMIQKNHRPVRDSNMKQDGRMVIDEDNLHQYQIPQATIVHQQVVERFTLLLRALVKRVGGAELEEIGKNGNSVSKHAPKWQQNVIPVEEYSAGDCLEYLQHKKRIVFEKPDPPLERFLRDPYSGKGALSGVEWSTSTWRAAAASLRQIGVTWQDDTMLGYVGMLEQYVQDEYG